ncbi:beta-ketoacyl-ACP synthase III [Clostridium paraputrificum]|uniref:beta-ketoacyl-ACP synthase III n=1 Tax=Clostridium TaxID=1485 RepID=UPI003D33D163
MGEINIKAFGAYAPSHIVRNNDLVKIVDTSDEWISSRTGINERRISKGEDTSQIAVKAANKALDRAGIKGKDIDLIIVATITPDMFTPSVACLVQKEIGATKAMAFDINAACSGFIYGLQTTYSMMSYNQEFKNALVIGAETLSKIIDWDDRSTCVLFGDGGGAVVLSNSIDNIKKKVSFYSKSEGDKGEYLTAGAFDVINPYINESNIRNKKVEMNGREVFKFATTSIVDGVYKVLEQSNLTIKDIDYIVPHQANYRIIDYSAKKLKIKTEKFYTNLDRYGNTSSGSIPIALNEMYERGILKEGNKIIMVGFGGGLTYGAVLVEL